MFTPIEPPAPPTATRGDPNSAAHTKIGGIPLPVFIAIVLFGPFALSFIGYAIYHWTIRRPRERKQLADESCIEAGRQHAERQYQSFVGAENVNREAQQIHASLEEDRARRESGVPMATGVHRARGGGVGRGGRGERGGQGRRSDLRVVLPGGMGDIFPR